MKEPALRYRLDDLLIDTGARCVSRNGVDLGVTGLSFDLLLALGRVAPNLLSTEALIETVWPGQVVSTETLTQRVKLLRQQLDDDATKPRYVASRRGHGYRLVSRLMPVSGNSAAPGAYHQAHELLLQARVIMRGTHESRDRALVLVDQALARDSQFAPALAYRAVLLAGSVPLSGAAPERLATAEQDAIRALDADPKLVDAHVARALVCASRFGWVDAEQHFATALSLSPTDPFVRNLYVLNVLRPTGRLALARTHLEQTYELDPAAGFTAHELALTHCLLGDDAAALRFVDLAHALSGVGDLHWDLMIVRARAEARSGRFAAAAKHALEALPSALQRHGGASVMNTLYSALGDPSQKERACAELRAFVPHLHEAGVDGRTRAFFITSLATLGALDAAYDAVSQVNVDLSDLWLPEMRAFRQDRRFRRLTQRVALDEYWKRHGGPDAVLT